MRSSLRLATVLVSLAAISGGAVANACPPPSPEARTFGEMIKQHTTGYPDFPIMILGKVVVIKDLGGGPRGKAIAKLAVAAHPTGFAPLVSRVRFYRPKPADDPLAVYERFSAGRLYVVIASRRHDGSFAIPQICGPSRGVLKQTFWRLVRLARRQ